MPINSILKSLIPFVLAGFAKIGGGYLIRQWLREGKALWFGFVVAAVLFLCGVIPTFQTESVFGRVYAAYGDIFILLSILCGMVFDGWHPDRFDLISAAIALIGVSVILWDVCCFDNGTHQLRTEEMTARYSRSNLCAHPAERDHYRWLDAWRVDLEFWT